jgi:1,6-anhydro-N-acetylmuramate kinase
MPRAKFSNVPSLSQAPDPEGPRRNRLARRDSEGRRYTEVRHVAGCMTGTSLDGLDVALMRLDGAGPTMRASLVAETSRPLGELAGPLRRLAEQQPLTAQEIASLARDLALLHLDALTELKRRQPFDLVCVHGQTVVHAPPLSWQLMNPAPIAHGLGVPVVYDLRAADLACGGEGAPLTPLADLVLFGHATENRVVVNLGGFCNLTRLPKGREPKQIGGGDVCACNQLLDAVARLRLGCAYDRDGGAALAGQEDAAAVESLKRLLAGQARQGRSLGTGDELAQWLDATAGLPPADVAATAVSALAQTIAAAATPTDRLIIAGGGVRNRALVEGLKQRCDAPVDLSDVHGIPATLREAAGFAILGALCQDRVPITLPQVTKVRRAPVAGSWVLP